MELQRTANSGVLIEMDGQRILLDGVCPPYKTYLGTPLHIRESLLNNPPDLVAFTHSHADHYDEDFSKAYQNKTLRLVYGAEEPINVRVGEIEVFSFLTRHLGKHSGENHVSYIIKGSKTILFTGDASPSVFENLDFPKPDIVIATFAYGLSPSAYSKTKSLGAEKIILLHMPSTDNDPYNIWETVKSVIAEDKNFYILSMEEKIFI